MRIQSGLDIKLSQNADHVGGRVLPLMSFFLGIGHHSFCVACPEVTQHGRMRRVVGRCAAQEAHLLDARLKIGGALFQHTNGIDMWVYQAQVLAFLNDMQ